MQDYEKLGVFYLGRRTSPAAPDDALLLYDSRDLVTHAMIVGMTGSGKTGLGIALLEEAGMDRVPAIAIDPKGDLTNLLLTFPELAPSDFRPWIDEDAAARQGLSADDYAAQQATTWRDGLKAWDQDGDRIARFRQAVDLAIYTPGSSAGRPLSLLQSFAAPPDAIRDDAELLSQRVEATVSGLLGLVGVTADPLKSREHILLSTIFGAAWRAGESIDLERLIARIQQPPVTRVGVMDVETFYPSKDRFELATRLNALVASPGFSSWLEGDPLDIDSLLFTPSGQPRIAVISIAHLPDKERMFVVSLLVNEIVAWMRRQAGTTSLRALLYMDEVAGYLPPIANPTSKPAFLTLLKQARAYGLGVALATQNPVDLDYRALTNIGTWMIGRLQTERDKGRLLDGLEGAAAAASHEFDRATINAEISKLGKRTFLLHNVHDSGPTIFETRWVMSYLCGPLTRDQIRRLSNSTQTAPTAAAPPPAPVTAASTEVTPDTAAPAAVSVTGGPRPILPPGVPQAFLHDGETSGVAYVPRLFATAQVGFTDAKLGVSDVRTVTVLAPVRTGPVPVDWASAVVTPIRTSDLRDDGVPGATFGDVPAPAANVKNYAAWTKEFARWVGETQTIAVLREPGTGLVSKPEETERDFRIRLQLAVRERRDAEKQRLEAKYKPKFDALEEKIRKAQQALTRENEQASQQKVHAMLSVGSSLLGALFGRKVASAANVGRASTAARSAGRVLKESQDIRRAQENLDQLLAQRDELHTQFAADIAAVDAAGDASTLSLETLSVAPKKTQVAVDRVVLAWVPASMLVD